jgi:hypothetical protein
MYLIISAVINKPCRFFNLLNCEEALMQGYYIRKLSLSNTILNRKKPGKAFIWKDISDYYGQKFIKNYINDLIREKYIHFSR